ncbi:hypothetical protein [Cupriavidus sp. TMH.W2]|uniref:hypothetical protein n=1 Tax=Cupriavidus sp. TMH.W2 TaxID=3434465 RepID=UPI003D77A42D
MPLQLGASWALLAGIAITLYALQRDPAPLSASTMLAAVGWGVLPLAVVAALGALCHAIALRRARRAERALKAQQLAVAAAHPGARATPLSNGRWLLADLATGKTVGEVDAPA